MPALNRLHGWRMLSNKSHTTCVTVATSRNSFPRPGRPGTNFDKVAAISDKIETNRKNRNTCLTGGLQCYKALQSMPVTQWPTIDTFIAHLAEAEQQYRNRKRTEMYLKTSKLRYNAVMEDIICSEERNLTKDTLLTLMDCTFIDNRAENLLIDGKTGC